MLVLRHKPAWMCWLGQPSGCGFMAFGDCIVKSAKPQLSMFGCRLAWDVLRTPGC